MPRRPGGRPGATAVLRLVLHRPRGPQVALATLLFVSHQAGELAVPVIAGLAIDRAVVTGDLGALVAGSRFSSVPSPSSRRRTGGPTGS
ncbi:MAG: hypothetical protein ACRD29_26495 [Acidimicrobiales bacterium]